MDDTTALALIKTELERDRRCACGHFQLPPTRDACAIIAPGVSAQHGRLHCEQIELGKQAEPTFVEREHTVGWGRRRRTIIKEQRIQPPREVRLSRLDRR